MNCSLSGSSHDIFQARVLEWVAISFSRGSSTPGDRIRVSHIVGRSFTIWATREVSLVVKNLPTNAGDTRDTDSITGLGRSPRAGHGKPLQYSCLKNPMDRGAWWAIVHGVALRVGHDWVTKQNTTKASHRNRPWIWRPEEGWRMAFKMWMPSAHIPRWLKKPWNRVSIPRECT